MLNSGQLNEKYIHVLPIQRNTNWKVFRSHKKELISTRDIIFIPDLLIIPVHYSQKTHYFNFFRMIIY
jgi:hypothetical protein